MNRFSERLPVLVASAALLLIPAAAIGSGGTFDDVPDGHMFEDDIAWLASTGVTKGCNVGGTLFCPDDTVTRGQMAAFLHRLAVAKVVDAKTAMSASAADNADRLDGLDSAAFAASGHDHDSAYLAIGGKAADADKFDGLDSSIFMYHGSMTTTMGPEGWLAHSNFVPSSVSRLVSLVSVSGDGAMVHGLTGPATINSVQYGLDSVEVCLLLDSGAYLDYINIWRTTNATTTTNLLYDETDRTTTGCHVYPVNRSLGKGAGVMLNFAGGGTAAIHGTTLTWSTDIAVP